MNAPGNKHVVTVSIYGQVNRVLYVFLDISLMGISSQRATDSEQLHGLELQLHIVCTVHTFIHRMCNTKYLGWIRTGN